MIRRFLTRTALAVACLTALPGCVSMAPRYARPDAPVLVQFPDLPGAGATDVVSVANLDWQQVFLDPQLQHVISLALENNRDLRIALLNIEQTRAQYRIQRADLLPTVQASVSQSAARNSAQANTFGAGGIIRSASAEVGFSSWELDIFGRIRSLKKAALETWLATTETQRSTRLTLVAEVASTWLAVAADQQHLALARQTLDSRQQTLRLTEAQHQEGTASALDVAKIQTSVESARSDVASYTTQLATDRNALQLLVGAPVTAALLPQGDRLQTSVALAPIPGNLESRVLLQRPDVLSAEHSLKSANANIGAARAAFFPTLSLTAASGHGSTALSSLFDADTRTWSFAPSISVPIFDAGALKGELDVAKIKKDIQIATYEKTIQTAFSEVADALAERANLDDQLDAQAALVDASQRNSSLSEARWRNGTDSYLEALDAQRTLYSAQQNQVTLYLSEANNRVTLYKVLGGGAYAQSTVAINSDAGGR
ncbi:efflux transporter outer membrane subunit [Xanthomonas maliensis]|uniref:efflux transporter outer membrane subunit n=1 Tax=Xanthomonas maliensis TaxID=1321368 RepID=UPI00039DE586|nr:efflux transporter outer membrane subunit [Xanthomonas maliensis]KAB7764314.1 transporter [Xanthomonas maliensis]